MLNIPIHSKNYEPLISYIQDTHLFKYMLNIYHIVGTSCVWDLSETPSASTGSGTQGKSDLEIKI